MNPTSGIVGLEVRIIRSILDKIRQRNVNPGRQVHLPVGRAIGYTQHTVTSSPITFRTLGPSDWAAIIAVWEVTEIGHKPKGRDSAERITSEMAMPNNRFIGAFDGSGMVGVVIANYDGRRGWINRLAVHPDCRGRGVAGQLLEQAESFLNEKGAMVISALVEGDNAASTRAFSKNGYSSIDSLKYFSKRPNWDV